jgi:PIN domain nuclease of toxin-antitoxin system
MIVLDACALIALIRHEPGAEVVERLINDEQTPCLIHVVNLCEVYYDLLRSTDEATAQQAIVDIESVGVVFRDDIDRDFWQMVGYYKATLARVSLADCFALSLAHRTDAEIATSDHHEFDRLVAQGVCKIQFIR